MFLNEKWWEFFRNKLSIFDKKKNNNNNDTQRKRKREEREREKNQQNWWFSKLVKNNSEQCEVVFVCVFNWTFVVARRRPRVNIFEKLFGRRRHMRSTGLTHTQFTDSPRRREFESRRRRYKTSWRSGLTRSAANRLFFAVFWRIQRESVIFRLFLTNFERLTSTNRAKWN